MNLVMSQAEKYVGEQINELRFGDCDFYADTEVGALTEIAACLRVIAEEMVAARIATEMKEKNIGTI